MPNDAQTDTQQWEFKFLRCHRLFSDVKFLQKAISEEAEAGWDLVEKLDDNRVRLRRPVSARENDRSREQDPYRTMSPSMSEEMQRRGNRNLKVFGSVMLAGAIFFASLLFLLE